jgi:capsular polysaccharide transport system permease protein
MLVRKEALGAIMTNSADAIELPATGGFLRGLGIQLCVLYALMIREMMMRYGRNNIGFLWLVLEPMILCVGVIGLRWLIQAHQEHGVSLVALILSGYMPLTLWRHLTNKSAFLLRRSMAMLFHHQVTILDAWLTAMTLEFIGCTLAFIVNYAALLFIGAVDPIHDYGLVVCGWCLMALLAASVGAAIAVLTELYETSERFIQPMQYLILPVSGFLFMVDWLPDNAQKLAWYMPMIHAFEMIRDGFFGDAVQTHHTAAYPLIFSLVLFAIFIPMIDKVRDHIHYG